MKKALKLLYSIVTIQILNMLFSSWVWAEGVAEGATEGVVQVAKGAIQAAESSGGSGLYALAAGLAIAIAAFGGALGQGRVGAAAMEGIARNPQSQKIMFIPMIIVLALIESFVIFSFAIAMIIAGKI